MSGSPRAEAPYFTVRVSQAQANEQGVITYRCALDTNLPSYADAIGPISARRRFSEFVELKDSLGVYSETAGAAALLPPLRIVRACVRQRHATSFSAR